ncbi:MAG: SRPBCC domain-containing protein [Balneolales bacterium]
MKNIEHINYIHSPASTVFEALTTKEGLSETWTRECRVEPWVGFINEFGFGDEVPTKFKIVELVPNKKIIWHCVESDPEWVGTTVSFDLAEKGGVSSVTLRHKDWKEVTEFYQYCNYNWGFFLYSLKQYCEEGKGIPFQKRKF